MAHTIDPEVIKIGPADLWWGITLPAPGVAMAHDATGEPTDGNYIGMTEGPAVFTYTPTVDLEDAEQMLSPVEGFVTEEKATLEFNLKEWEAAKLQQVLQTVSLTVDNTGDVKTDLLEGGGNQWLHGIGAGQRGCFLSTPQVGNFSALGVQLYTHLTLFRVINSAPFVASFDRRKGTIYKCTFETLAAVDRPVGNRLFQLVKERAV